MGRASLIRRNFHPFSGLILLEFAMVGALALICGAGISAQTHARAQTHAVANSDAAAAPVKSLGNRNAPITMEVFSDYQCPSCGNFYVNTLKYMIQDMVASGQVYFIHRDFPLPMHPYSYMAARWANAAAKIGKFEVVDAALWDNQQAWSADGNIEKFVAAAVGPTDFKRIKKLMEGCDVNPNASAKPAAFKNNGQEDHGCALDTYIEQDKQLAKQVPVTQTPTSVITAKSQRYPAMPGFVTWPILKQFLSSLLSQ
jgi:protein-disulfide isomerase